MPACHEGLAYPAQPVVTYPLVLAPLAQPLGPPLPPEMSWRSSSLAIVLLQKPLAP